MMAVGLQLLITFFWGLRSAQMCTAAAHERNERAHRPSASRVSPEAIRKITSPNPGDPVSNALRYYRCHEAIERL